MKLFRFKTDKFLKIKLTRDDILKYSKFFLKMIIQEEIKQIKIIKNF